MTLEFISSFSPSPKGGKPRYLHRDFDKCARSDISDFPFQGKMWKTNKIEIEFSSVLF